MKIWFHCSSRIPNCDSSMFFTKKQFFFIMNSQFSIEKCDGSMVLALPLQIPLGFRNFLNTNADSSMFLYVNSTNSLSCRNFFVSRKSVTSYIITNGRKKHISYKTLIWIYWLWHAYRFQFFCMRHECLHENLISLFIPHSKWWHLDFFHKKAMRFHCEFAIFNTKNGTGLCCWHCHCKFHWAFAIFSTQMLTVLRFYTSAPKTHWAVAIFTRRASLQLVVSLHMEEK